MTCFTTDAIPSDLELIDHDSPTIYIVAFKGDPTVLIMPESDAEEGVFIRLRRWKAVCIGVKLIWNAVFVR